MFVTLKKQETNTVFTRLLAAIDCKSHLNIDHLSLCWDAYS